MTGSEYMLGKGTLVSGPHLPLPSHSDYLIETSSAEGMVSMSQTSTSLYAVSLLISFPLAPRLQSFRLFAYHCESNDRKAVTVSCEVGAHLPHLYFTHYPGGSGDSLTPPCAWPPTAHPHGAGSISARSRHHLEWPSNLPGHCDSQPRRCHRGWSTA